MNSGKQSAMLLVCTLWIAIVFGFPTTPIGATDGGHDIDFNALVDDTQKQTPDPDRLTMVWWLPEEFWVWSFSQDQSLTDDGVAEILSVLRPYVVMIVLDGTVGPLGGATFVDPKRLHESVVFVDAKGSRHKPLDGDEVSADARNLAAMLAPMLANMLGPTGENMGVFFFPAAMSDGGPTASATAKGTFAVEVGDKVMRWTTPLGSVLPRKVCPVDDEEMSGAWSYCPWHGKKLVGKVRATQEAK